MGCIPASREELPIAVKRWWVVQSMWVFLKSAYTIFVVEEKDSLGGRIYLNSYLHLKIHFMYNFSLEKNLSQNLLALCRHWEV